MTRAVGILALLCKVNIEVIHTAKKTLMKIDSIGKRAISSYVMQFDQDELSGDQLQDPFVKFS